MKFNIYKLPYSLENKCMNLTPCFIAKSATRYAQRAYKAKHAYITKSNFYGDLP